MQKKCFCFERAGRTSDGWQGIEFKPRCGWSQAVVDDGVPRIQPQVEPERLAFL